jgi:hypothetical protein
VAHLSSRSDQKDQKIVLLIIDPQIDFHPAYDPPDPEPIKSVKEKDAVILLDASRSQDSTKKLGQPRKSKLSHIQGSLAVPGANEDSQRIAKMIRDNIDQIHEIHVTMDSHHVSACRAYVLYSAFAWYRRTDKYSSILLISLLLHVRTHAHTEDAHRPRHMLEGCGGESSNTIYGDLPRRYSKREVDSCF